jgi:membrane-bound lytic murein transglycosylase B
MPKKAVKTTAMPTQAILTRAELEFYLSRAVTMAGVGSDPKSNNTLGNEIGVSYGDMRQAHLDFIYRTGAQFIGRVERHYGVNGRIIAAFIGLISLMNLCAITK